MSSDANSFQGNFTVDATGHLPAGSAAINAGTTVSQVTNDIDGQARQAPYDIGADEYGQTQSGPTRANGSQPMIRGALGASATSVSQAASPTASSVTTTPAATSGQGAKPGSASAVGRVAPVRASIRPPIVLAWIKFNSWLETLKRQR